MAESECRVDEVTWGSESSELDCSLDLFFEEEEGPAIPEGRSDNHLPVRAYRYEPYLALDADAIPPTPASPPGDEAVTVQCQRPTSKHRLVNLYYTSYRNESFAGCNEPVKSVDCY